MIVKKVSKKVASQSSFRKLSDYMMDEKNGRDKVENYRFTNCSFEEIKDNLLEIENTQAQNTRSFADKTYHLIVSFQEDEDPSHETMRYIEEELVKSIGFEQHQRFSVVHGNTNNKHIHIAINKIENHRFHCIDPFQDVPKLHQRAIELECELNLKKDNHVTKSKEKSSAQEIHAGIVSFKDWIKEHATGAITQTLAQEGANWDALHQTLGEYDLELTVRGNGLVIAHRAGKLFVKASDISRELSKGKLEATLGAFQTPTTITPAKTTFGFMSKDKTNHWDTYLHLKTSKANGKADGLAQQRASSLAQRQFIEISYKQKRESVKKNPGLTHSEKRIRYLELGQEKANEMQELKKSNQHSRAGVYATAKQISYKEYLIGKALEGDMSALDLLRRAKKQPVDEKSKEGNVVWSHDSKTMIDSAMKPEISKNGDVTYMLDHATKIIDKGDILKMSELLKDSHALRALHMAREKFGETLYIGGSDEFKKQMTLTAIKYKLEVKFYDQTMEQVRSAVVER